MQDKKYSPIIQTKRLVLRQWSEIDLEPFAKMNADPKVREYFPGLLTKEESDRSVSLFSSHIERCGWGLFAVSLAETGEFIGFIGLQEVHLDVAFVPAVEIGWRLTFEHWGRGYATEGALACLHYAFDVLKLSEVVSFTTVKNRRSRAVMERIGMHHDEQEDFDHPAVPEGHPLRPHVLYRLKARE